MGAVIGLGFAKVHRLGAVGGDLWTAARCQDFEYF